MWQSGKSGADLDAKQKGKADDGEVGWEKKRSSESCDEADPASRSSAFSSFSFTLSQPPTLLCSSCRLVKCACSRTAVQYVTSAFEIEQRKEGGGRGSFLPAAAARLSQLAAAAAEAAEAAALRTASPSSTAAAARSNTSLTFWSVFAEASTKSMPFLFRVWSFFPFEKNDETEREKSKGCDLEKKGGGEMKALKENYFTAQQTPPPPPSALPGSLRGGRPCCRPEPRLLM